MNSCKATSCGRQRPLTSTLRNDKLSDKTMNLLKKEF